VINDSVFFIEQWDSKQKVKFAQAVKEIRVSYDIGGCAQLTVSVVDEDLRMWNANYFQIGTTFVFKKVSVWRPPKFSKEKGSIIW